MCFSMLTPSHSGLTHQLSGSPLNPLFSSPEVGAARGTQLNSAGSSHQRGGQDVNSLPLSPPPLRSLTLSISVK
jgi:hypothetical protein